MTTAIAALFAEKMRKDNPTVADVHVSSAGGGNRPKRKAKMFSSAYVAKDAEWSITIPIQKWDEEKRQVFGWASVVTENGEVVEDLQGDRISEVEMEKAFHDYMKNARVAGEMHERTGVGELIGGLMLSRDIQDALGIDLGKVGPVVQYEVSPEVFAKVKSGEYRAFSIGGRGARTAI